MPGPKMGPRPVDFDEQLIRQSPTFIKWSQLAIGEKLRYACREFIKGNGDDEERLMRRIMIARRNNIRDHQTLKRARLITSASSSNNSEDLPLDNLGHDMQEVIVGEEAVVEVEEEAAEPQPPSMLEQAIALLPPPPSSKKAKVVDTTTAATGVVRKRRPSTLFSDTEVAKEMDVAAVEATRSFQAWKNLKDGEVFVYNQKYIKGQTNHEWLLKKNIWRRMRYRRENKKMVEKLRYIHSPTEPLRTGGGGESSSVASSLASQIIDKTLLPPTTNHNTSTDNDNGHTEQNHHNNHADLENLENHYQPLPIPGSIPMPPQITSSSEVDMTEAVQAAVKVAESYSQNAHYADAMVHNALDTSANSAALDAAARLAAAATIDEEAVAAATAATVDPSQFED